jgi:hypothetical protein
MADRLRTIFRYDPKVQRGSKLAKATLSPAGLVTGGLMAVVGIATGLVTLPWAIAAGAAAWLTSVVLHLRDPKLVTSLLSPHFDRDLSVLDAEHLHYMESALRARDRLEEATKGLPPDVASAGMGVRVTDVVHRVYDSVSWSQRASHFLASVDEQQLGERLARIDPASPVAEELREQLEVVETVARRRDETMAQVASTITGIETLAVKTAGLALGAPGSPTDMRATDEIRQLRQDLDHYADGLAEIEKSLRESLPST